LLASTSFLKNALLVRSEIPVSIFGLDDPGIMNSPSHAFAEVVGARSVIALSADTLSSRSADTLSSRGCLRSESRNPPNQILAGVIGIVAADVDEVMCLLGCRGVVDVEVRRSCEICNGAGERHELFNIRGRCRSVTELSVVLSDERTLPIFCYK